MLISYHLTQEFHAAIKMFCLEVHICKARMSPIKCIGFLVVIVVNCVLVDGGSSSDLIHRSDSQPRNATTPFPWPTSKPTQKTTSRQPESSTTTQLPSSTSSVRPLTTLEPESTTTTTKHPRRTTRTPRPSKTTTTTTSTTTTTTTEKPRPGDEECGIASSSRDCELPFYAAIYMKGSATKFGRAIKLCSGAILNKRTVLFSYSCFADFKRFTSDNIRKVEVVVSESHKYGYRSKNITRIKARICDNKYFKESNIWFGWYFDYDFGIAQLDKDIAFTNNIRPVCLGRNDDKVVDYDRCKVMRIDHPSMYKPNPECPKRKPGKLDSVSMTPGETCPRCAQNVKSPSLCADYKPGMINLNKQDYDQKGVLVCPGKRDGSDEEIWTAHGTLSKVCDNKVIFADLEEMEKKINRTIKRCNRDEEHSKSP